jgi:hypothetical protein
MRALVKPLLDGALRSNRSGWRDVLTEESLLGRYLDEISGKPATNGDKGQ